MPDISSKRASDRFERGAFRVAAVAIVAFALAYRAATTAEAVEPVDRFGQPAVANASYDDGIRNPGEPFVSGPIAISVLIDHLRRIAFEDEITTVLIGNPAIADVTMISSREAVLAARSIGSTNVIFIARDGRAVGDFEVVVREGDNRRVILRRGAEITELYQCAPRCERALSQLDSAAEHKELLGTITAATGLADTAATANSDEAAQ